MFLRIAMPTLGRSVWWSEAVNSAASIQDGECVVVCPDEAYPAEDVRRVRDAGAGLYAAVNAGLRAAGDWEAGTYLNDDDRLIASGVLEARRRMEADRRVGAVFGRVDMIDREGARVTEIPVARRGEDLGPLLASGIVPLAQPGTIFRREMFDALGGFDPAWRAAGDMDFFLRAWKAGWKFEFLDACVAEFRVHAGQISQQGVVVEEERGRLIGLARENRDWVISAPGAKWRFRRGNLSVYAARLRRHGFVSMARLYREGAR